MFSFEELLMFTDEELLASARENAFEGLLKITALRDAENEGLRTTLREHFIAILRAIDDPVTRNPEPQRQTMSPPAAGRKYRNRADGTFELDPNA